MNVYNSIVDARSWGKDIPQSLMIARQYTSRYNPASFFKYLGPVQLVIAILNIILMWGMNNSQSYLIGAFILYLGIDILTLKYFFPRNDILFRDGNLSDVQSLRKTWREWSRMNWVRSGLMLAALILVIYVFMTNFSIALWSKLVFNKPYLPLFRFWSFQSSQVFLRDKALLMPFFLNRLLGYLLCIIM